jgi:biotin transport system substrate-specific component
MHTALTKSFGYNKLAVRAGLVFLFFALTSLAGFVRIQLPISPVPFTLQTVVVLLAGAFLGGTGGFLSQALYIGIGLSGFAAFSTQGSGFLYLAGPTGGYIIGFMLAAWVIGALIRYCRGDTVKIFILFCAADALLLLCGTMWLRILLGYSLKKAVMVGLVPFIPADILKIWIALLLYKKLSARKEKLF